MGIQVGDKVIHTPTGSEGVVVAFPNVEKVASMHGFDTFAQRMVLFDNETVPRSVPIGDLRLAIDDR